jgi:hypothetical protein
LKLLHVGSIIDAINTDSATPYTAFSKVKTQTQLKFKTRGTVYLIDAVLGLLS